MTISNILFFLFLLPFLCIFKLGGTYGSDGLGQIFYLLYYYAIAIWGIILLILHKNTNKKIKYNIWGIILFLLITSHYITICRHGIKALDYLFPLIIWPPLTILWILVRKLKFWYFYLLCFVAVPIFFSIKDFIKEQQFSISCEQQTPSIQYNPIYLPEKFFHMANGKLEANIIEVDGKYNEKKEWISYLDERLYEDEDYHNQILVYTSCSDLRYIKNIKNILKNISANNVVLCHDRSIKETSSEVQQIVNTINLVKDGKKEPIVTDIRLRLAAKPFIGSFLAKKGKKNITYCTYSDYDPQNNTLWRKIKTDKSYSKFIKIKKNNGKFDKDTSNEIFTP